jgi:hypothetical protein
MSEIAAKQQLVRGEKTARIVGLFCILFGTLAVVPALSDAQRKPALAAAIELAAAAGVILVPGLIYFFLAGTIRHARRWAAVVVFAVASIQTVVLGISLVTRVRGNAEGGSLLMGALLAAVALLLAVESGRCMSAAGVVERADAVRAAEAEAAAAGRPVTSTANSITGDAAAPVSIQPGLGSPDANRSDVA